jgi:hypothetical protein
MTIRLTMAFSDNPRVQPLKDGAEDNVWFNGRTRELSHGGALGLDKAAPKGVAHHWLTADQTLDQMARTPTLTLPGSRGRVRVGAAEWCAVGRG